MGIIALIFFGAIVGRLSGFFVSKKGGVLRNILIGIVGSFIGGGIAQFFGFGGITGFNLYSILIGVIGSVILVSIVHAIKTT